MKTLYILVLTASTPSFAFAQGAIAGSVKAGSGVPLPAVIVQAASPTLIERARLAVTDSRGQYRIENLRPGTYAVSFTLHGWQPYRRDGIELSGSSIVVVNAELTIGTVAEAITVTGELPVVDAHSLNRELVLSSDVVRSIPTVRSYNALLVLVPGITTTSNDIVTGTATTSFPVHGGRTNEGRLTLDGLNIGSPPSGNSATSYVVDTGTSEEVTFRTATALGETETAGLVMNIIPRSGGNTIRGSVFASATGARLQSDNLTPALRAQGVTAATPLTGVYDVTATLGGPIAKDRLWYFVNAHAGASTRASANVFYNLNAAQSLQWLYAPDLNRPEYSDRTFENASGRVTWQVTPRHKISGFWDTQQLCRACTGATPGLAEPQRVSPEAVGVLGRPLRVAQAAWSSPLTDRLLVDAGFGATFFGVGNFERDPNPTRGLVRVAEQCASGCAAQWQHPRTGLPIAGLQRRLHRFVSLAGRADLRHRRPQFEGRVSAHLHDRRPHVDDQRPEPDVPIRQRRAEPVDTVDLAVGQQRPGGLAGPICPGSMDARSDDAAGSRAIRPGVELVPQATGRTVAVPSDAYHHRRNTGSRQLQGRDATDGRGLRRERDRQDCAEDDPRQVPRWCRRVRHVRQHKSLAAHAADDVGVRHRRGDTRLDRRQSEFRTRLRSDERRGTRSSGRGRRSVRHRLEHELRQERAHQQFRSGIARRLGRPAVRLASWRLDRAADRLAIVGRRHLHPPLVRRVFARGQPRAAGVRSDAIQHRGASRPSIAWWRRLRCLGPVRCRAGEGGRGRQPRRRFNRLRKLVSGTSTASTSRSGSVRSRDSPPPPEPAQVRPSPTIAMYGHVFRSSQPRRPARAHSAQVSAPLPSRR